MKLALLHNYHPVLRLHSRFTNCFSYVLYRRGLVQNRMSYLVVMPLSSPLKHFFSLFSTFISVTFLKITGQLFCKRSQFWFVWCLSMVSFRLYIVRRNKMEVVLYSCWLLSGKACFWFVPLLLTFILIICLRWHRPVFCTIKLIFFLFTYLEEHDIFLSLS